MAINIKTNDLEILWTPSGATDPNLSTQLSEATDARVPSAEELAASSHLHQQNLEKAQEIERPAGLRNRPVFSCTAKSVILPSGLTPYAPGHPALAPLADNVTAALPALADTNSTISRYDYIYLMVFGVVVTAAVDSDIILDFEWKAQNGTIQTLSKENTRRIRTVWAVVHSQGTTTATAVYNALPTTSGKKLLTVSKSSSGSAVGSFRVYPLDPNLIDTKIYEVIQDTVTLVDLCRVWRVQNFNQSGYVWGRNGEANFELDFHVQPTYRYVGNGWDDWEQRGRETLRRVFLGLPLINSPTYDRAVENLLNGQVSANQDAPGIATASPNGSTALANNQRISFTNEGAIQTYYCLPVTTENAGGFARASVPFQTNSPSGSYFSQNLADHKVWSATGRDITGDGTLTGLGSTGALVWTANSNAVVAPGDVVYVQPGIYYPPGSGFSKTGAIEKVFLDNTQITAGNVREGSASGDVDAYTAPANNETYLVVVGKERAALHYVYKRITVASSSGGVLAIPSTERGVIAFISGTGAPSGRQDKPVITGLSNSTNYNLLIYYPPKATENWQFQFKTARYAGSGERSWVSGAKVAAPPVTYAHTQGGGNSAFLGEGELQYEAISFRLPANTLNGSVGHWLANHRIQFVNEGEAGSTSFREVPLNIASALTSPRVGMELGVVNGVGSQSKGIAARLQVGGQNLGALKLPIEYSQIYQLVVGLLLQKTGEYRLLVVTLNGGNPAVNSAIAFDADSPHFAGIDTFPIY